MGKKEYSTQIKKAILIALGIIFFSGIIHAQYYSSSQKQRSFFNPLSLSGKVYTEGYLDFQKKVNSNYTDYPRINNVIGGLRLDTKSFILHPNLLLLDIDGELNSGLKQSYFYVFDNRSEMKSNQRIGINGTLLKNKKVRLNFNTNYINGLKNNEDVARIKVKSFRKGVGIASTSRYFPFVFNINEYKIENKNLLNNQHFERDGVDLVSRLSKSFSSHDFSQVTYNYQSSQEIRDTTFKKNTKIHKAQINNRIYFDKKKKYTLNSNLFSRFHSGSYNYEQYNISERLYLKLPYRFDLRADYTYQNFSNANSTTISNDIRGSLNHKLYKSLNTKLLYQKTFNRSSFQNENLNQGEFGLLYTKKIPKGILQINYQYKNLGREVKSSSSIINVYNEDHVLGDGNIELLELPYVNTESIIVTDISGSIVYQRDFDYIVIERDNYTEIQRVPGGRIVNNSIVMVSYTATQQGDYSYTSISNFASIRLEFFKGLLQLYYNYIDNGYTNLFQTELLQLNYLVQHQYGLSTQSKYIHAGVEYIDKMSTISPYQQWNLFFKFKYHINRYNFHLNGNMKNYFMTNDLTYKKYYKISAGAKTQITSNSRINLLVGYSYQDGVGIFMNLLNSRLEYNLIIKQLELMCGIQYYHRYLEYSRVNFGRFYFKALRRF